MKLYRYTLFLIYSFLLNLKIFIHEYFIFKLILLFPIIINVFLDFMMLLN